MPQVTTARDCQPNIFVNDQPTTPQVVKRKDPLNLQVPQTPKRLKSDLVIRFPSDGNDVANDKAALQAACWESDSMVDHFKKRKEVLKKRLKRIEVHEAEEMKKELVALQKENAQLQERLIAARDLRKEAEHQLRTASSNSTPVGTMLLRY